jgi:hypothetical protein
VKKPRDTHARLYRPPPLSLQVQFLYLCSIIILHNVKLETLLDNFSPDTFFYALKNSIAAEIIATGGAESKKMLIKRVDATIPSSEELRYHQLCSLIIFKTESTGWLPVLRELFHFFHPSASE